MNKRMPKTILIDADIACFQIACVNQQEYQWDDETVSSVIDQESAVRDLEEFIESLLEATETQEALFCFSSSPNFRHEVLPTYKHNRKGSEKPKLFFSLQEYLQENYPVRQKPNLEADDVLGILATMNPGKYVIASLDKDLLQIPGVHYNWKKNEIHEVSEEDADKQFYLQALMGDPTDGYKGCPGIGVVKATSLLQSCEEVPDFLGDLPHVMWRAIVKAYESKGLTEEDALQQARVARILRASDYDFDRKKPILWSPS